MAATLSTVLKLMIPCSIRHSGSQNTLGIAKRSSLRKQVSDLSPRLAGPNAHLEIGWPTIDSSSDSSHGEGSLESAQAYAELLDSSCEAFKDITPQGGVGWFWHIWKDDMMDGWGVLDSNGNPKWDFHPRTSC
jgi:hypothetical protein